MERAVTNIKIRLNGIKDELIAEIKHFIARKERVDLSENELVINGQTIYSLTYFNGWRLSDVNLYTDESAWESISLSDITDISVLIEICEVLIEHQ
jgi:hypothetical protein